MKRLRIFGGSRLLHSLWSALALCLFGLSGYLGYLSLIESVTVPAETPDVVAATVLRSAIIKARGNDHPVVTGGDSRWGYALQLEVRQAPQANPEDSLRGTRSPAESATHTVVIRPLLPVYPVVRWLQQHFQTGREVQVQISPGSNHISGLWRLAAVGRGGVFPPLMLALFGVLCLATSLRYQSGLAAPANLPLQRPENAAGPAANVTIPYSSNS